MDTYDLYGIEHDDLDAVRSSIEKALNIKMAAHESEYLGGLYYRFEDESGGLLELYTNYNQVYEEWMEEDFKDKSILFNVNESRRGREIEDILLSKVKGISLLRRETL